MDQISMVEGGIHAPLDLAKDSNDVIHILSDAAFTMCMIV